MSRVQQIPFIKGPSAEGKRLPNHVRHELESIHNTDLSRVRVHEGHEATHLNSDAVTTGQDIFFAPGKFQPNTDTGRELIDNQIETVVQHQFGQSKPLAKGLVEVPETKAA